MTANPEAAVIAAIDALERDAIDELVDWQMTDSPAAAAEHGGARVRFSDRNGRTLWSGVLEGPVVDLSDARGCGAGGRSDLFAITPDGERIEPDAHGVLHFHPEDQVFMLAPGGSGGWSGVSEVPFRATWRGSDMPAEGLGTVSGPVADSGCGGNVT